jgi:hypothetical protein
MEIELVTIMRPGDTVLETLASLGKHKKQKETEIGVTKKKRKPHKPVLADPNVTSPTAPPPSEIDRTTGISSTRPRKFIQRRTRQYCAPYADLGRFQRIGPLQSQRLSTSGL